MAIYENDTAADDPVPDSHRVLADHFIRPPGYVVRRSSGSPAWLMFFTIEGEGCVRINNIDYICKKQDITIIKPGTPHFYFTKDNNIWEFYWVYFIPRNKWSEWLELPEICKGVISLSVHEQQFYNRIDSSFSRIVEDCRFADVIGHELALCNVEEIFLLLHRSFIKVKDKTLDPRIATIFDEISTNYAEQHTIDKLANKVCLSPSRLAHLYKEFMGESIWETLHQIRLEKAAQLLRFTSMSIAETSEIVGFRSSNYFTKKFKDLYGVSPLAYRGSKDR